MTALESADPVEPGRLDPVHIESCFSPTGTPIKSTTFTHLPCDHCGHITP